MSAYEIGIETARKTLGDLANRAQYAGEATYLTRHGRRVAAVAPLDRITPTPEEDTMTVTITTRTDPAGLYRRYPGQGEPQPCYVELDTRDGRMLADYDVEGGEGVAPEAVVRGLVRRYTIPALTAEAANRAMGEIAPLARRVVAGTERHWNGDNHVGLMSADAVAAEDELGRLLGTEGRDPVLYDGSDEIDVWHAESVLDGGEAEQYGITAQTTNARLDEICEEIRADLAGISESRVVILDAGVRERLYEVRGEAIEADMVDLYWSVVRGESPGARAVEPGMVGLDVPSEVLAWAEGHGLDESDPDVHLLVTTEDEAGEVIGEVACMTTAAPSVQAQRIRGALGSETADAE